MSRYKKITTDNANDLTQLAQTNCGFITDLAWSPDGKVLALAHGGGLWLWEDGFGGEPSRKLKGHTGPVKGIAFSPDGEVLASASADTTVRLWITLSGSPLHVLRRHREGVDAVAFSADGRVLASAGGDHMVQVFDMTDSTGSGRMEGHTNEITSAVFGGDVLATGGWDNTVRLWDIPERRTLAVITLDDWVRDLAASPDGQTLAAACKDGSAKLIDFASRAITRSIPAHARGVDAVAFAPGGDLLVTGGRDNAIKLWPVNPASDAPLVTLSGHTRPVLALAVHPSGNLLVSGGGDNTVRLWGIPEA